MTITTTFVESGAAGRSSTLNLRCGSLMRLASGIRDGRNCRAPCSFSCEMNDVPLVVPFVFAEELDQISFAKRR